MATQAERQIGWDVGGAHLKAALVEGGRLLEAVQLPCPLWRGIGELERAASGVLADWGVDAGHAITMTGELADLFPDRPSGVAQILSCMCTLLHPNRIRVFAGRDGWVDPGEAPAHALRIASANWRASAGYAAKRLREGLWVDIGSTTTDLVPFSAGRVRSRGETDAERLECEELVYTGVVRTPVCAVVDRAPLRGEWQGVVAEIFATMADVYRLLGRLAQDEDQGESADGRPKTEQASACRLARMLGRDALPEDLPSWRRVARYVARRQGERIHGAIDRILSREELTDGAPLVGAGVGSFLARELAQRLGRPYLDFSELCGAGPAVAGQASLCAPAVAVALLCGEDT